MILSLLALLTLQGAVPPHAAAPAKDARVFELRTYIAEPGRRDALLARFRNHTTKLLAKHGVTNVGYWVPEDAADNRLVYLVAFPNRKAREESGRAFAEDPEWKRVKEETERDGKLVTRVEAVQLVQTDYSPAVRPVRERHPRLFELRIYKALPGKLSDLNARFRHHTTRLFAKHGMKNIGYWTPLEKEKGADDTLVYLLAHNDRDAAKRSWAAFREDPVWVAARDASEKNGKLLDGAPQSLYLTPVDFSPLK